MHITTTHINPNYLKAIISHNEVEMEYWDIAILVARSYSLPISEMIGFRDCEAKIVACYLELKVSPCVHLRTISKKYNIYPGYLKNRIIALKKSFRNDEELRSRVKNIERNIKTNFNY